MELRHLRYFVAVAENLSFTSAARQLRVAQPALSRQIRQLEDEIGAKLFDRNRRLVALNAAGRGFLIEARKILRQSEHAVRAAQASAQISGGQLRVGYVWGLFHTVAPAALAAFRRENLLTAAHLMDMTATDQATALLHGGLDAAFIGFEREAKAAGLARRKIGSCKFVAALPACHSAAKQRIIHLRVLANQFFIAISEDAYPGAAEIASRACAKSGFRPKVLQDAGRGHTILGLVAANCGVALLPEPLEALPHVGVVFRPLADPPIGDLFLAWNARRMSDPLQIFLQSCAGINIHSA